MLTSTHGYRSTVCPTHPIHHLRSAPARRKKARPSHTTVAKLYQTELYSFLPIPENTSLRTHIYTVYTNRTHSYLPRKHHTRHDTPPTNTQSEIYFPCEYQVHLSQFRCGHYNAIPTYTHRIGQAPNFDCPHCNSG